MSARCPRSEDLADEEDTDERKYPPRWSGDDLVFSARECACLRGSALGRGTPVEIRWDACATVRSTKESGRFQCADEDMLESGERAQAHDRR